MSPVRAQESRAGRGDWGGTRALSILPYPGDGGSSASVPRWCSCVSQAAGSSFFSAVAAFTDPYLSFSDHELKLVTTCPLHHQRKTQPVAPLCTKERWGTAEDPLGTGRLQGKDEQGGDVKEAEHEGGTLKYRERERKGKRPTGASLGPVRHFISGSCAPKCSRSQRKKKERKRNHFNKH